MGSEVRTVRLTHCFRRAGIHWRGSLSSLVAAVSKCKKERDCAGTRVWVPSGEGKIALNDGCRS